jgi:hypothetical protein
MKWATMNAVASSRFFAARVGRQQAYPRRPTKTHTISQKFTLGEAAPLK